MKLPKFISDNITLKITSANTLVVSIRLIISVMVQRIVSSIVGEAGYAIIGQIRSVLVMLTSTSTLGVFNGIVKHVSEHKDEQQTIARFFSTVNAFVVFGIIVSSLTLWFGSSYWSDYIFNTTDYDYIFKILALVVPCIALNRVFNGVINGLSAYKKYAKIELISYILGAVLTLLGAIYYGLDGVIIAIAIVPAIQLSVLIIVFGKVLKQYGIFKNLKFSLLYKNTLLAFTLMSFISSFLIPFIEIDIISIIKDQIGANEAGHWVSVNFLSKNYMVFSTGIFTLYVLPKFATISKKLVFKNEVIHIYKTILPLFAVGMLLVYVFRFLILEFVFPKFPADAIAPLFKWQLMGDFIRLCTLVLTYQFLAKRLVKSYIITEFISLALFYGLTHVFIKDFGTEGVVMAHFIRYIIYFIVVVLFIWYYFNKKAPNSTEVSN